MPRSTVGVGGGIRFGPAPWELSPTCKVRLAQEPPAPPQSPTPTTDFRSALQDFPITPPSLLSVPLSPARPAPWEQPGHPIPLPGCAPGSSATLGSGPGVVPGSEAGRQKLRSDGLRCKVSRDHLPPQAPTLRSTVLQTGVGRALWKGVA